MLLWLQANLGTILVAAVLLAIVCAIVYSMRSTKKRGGTSCGGSCGSCAGCAGCAAGRGCGGCR